MNNKNHQAGGLVLYSLPNYAGLGTRVNHGQTGIVASTSTNWVEQSVSVGDNTMYSWFWSSVDTSNPEKDYRGHTEKYIHTSIPNLEKVFSSAQCPLQYLGLDNTQAVPVVVEMGEGFTAEDAFAATSVIPGSTGNVTTLGLTGLDGGLGFIGTDDGSATQVNLLTGTYNDSNGQVDWSGSASLRILLDDNQLEITDVSGLPADWGFGTPEQQADGSWRVTLIVLESTNTLQSLTSDKSSIQDNNSDSATLTATVVDQDGILVAGVTVNWKTTLGTLSNEVSQTNEAGKAQTSFIANTVGSAVITASLSGGNSKSTTIEVAEKPVTGLLVMGARSSNRPYGEYSYNRLVALDPVSFSPVIATWQYSGESTSSSDSAFLDIYPDRILTVSNSGYTSLTLNVANIVGSGGWYDEDDDPGSTAAFSARNDDAAVVVWGNPARGGSSPASADNYDAFGLCASASAFAAIRENGSAFAWGKVSRGGDIPDAIGNRTGIVDLRAGRGTFLLRATLSPYIQTWGLGSTVDDPAVPGLDLSVPSNIAAMADIEHLQMTDQAAAVVNTRGQVFAFGDAACGGAPDSKITSLSGIFACYASRDAFAVLYDTGKVAAWGNTQHGGDARPVSGYSDIVRLCGTQSAFLGLRAGGEILAWGQADQGGSIPDDYLTLSDAVDIKSTYAAFAVLRSNGSVVSWGDEDHGGITPSGLSDVVAITATSYSFAALRSDGTVFTWGNAESGGDSSAVSASLINVRAIYSNSRAFIALKQDNTVVVWGEEKSGGAQDDVPSGLNGNISYSL